MITWIINIITRRGPLKAKGKAWFLSFEVSGVKRKRRRKKGPQECRKKIR